MKKSNYPYILLSFLFCSLILSCKKDDTTGPINTNNDTLSALDLSVNKFIWSGLHDYYLWVDEVPNLSYTNFSSEEDWIDFLNIYNDHEELFYSLLYRYNTVDRFSWIVDDYTALEQQLQGISKSMGYEFQLGRFSNSDNLFGVVMYVLKGSPAEGAGLKRGNIFLQVNGQDLTESNYQSLLLENTHYYLSLGVLSNNGISLGHTTDYMTAVEIYENPIYLDTVYISGSKKIGYLVYNGFLTEYDIQLNEVFSNFKNENIDELILDLRYNSGGAGNSATYLASMIYSTDTNKVFFTREYNTLFQEFLDSTYGPQFSTDKFADKIVKTETTPETPIVSLGLNKLYMITTHNTASASELVINGLKPYIDVITIGTTTYGKNVGSITIYDWDSVGNVKPDHKWAMQPIVSKAVNSAGESDYIYGFTPTDSISENIATLSSFGNINEPLLNKAIEHITGSKKKSTQSTVSNLKFVPFCFSKDFKPFAKEMYFRNDFLKMAVIERSQRR